MKGKSLFFFTILAICLNIIKNEKCGPGCLACGPSSCEICDSEQFYFLTSNGSCVQKIIDNCEIPSTNLEEIICFQCLSGFFLNQNGKTCQEVPQKYQIANCERYHWDYSCLACKTKYYLNDERKCEESSNEIAKCEIYLDPKICSKCSSGYFFNIGAEECQPIPEISKCKVYSSIQCERCANGYFQPEDLSSGNSLSGEFLQALVSYNKSQSNSKLYENSPMNNCALGAVSNCEKHSSYDSCEKCEEGYFLNFNNKCVEFPNRSISFCSVYLNSETCQKCQSGYYLENNKCFNLNTNDGCLEFNTALEKCEKCNNSTHFLSSGDCHVRIKSNNVNFCKDLNQSADECGLCVLSFKLTDDKLKCLPFIPHCSEYVSDPNSPSSNEFTNINTLEHICKNCEIGFYLMESKRKCVPQDKIGCENFTDNTNDCTQCASGYYLASDSCLRNTATNCKTYSTAANECIDCLVGYFKNGANCQKYTAKNCSTLESDQDQCESCNLGFKLSTDKTECIPLTTINCKGDVDNNGNCTACHDGYYLKDGNCLPVTHRYCLQTSGTTNTCLVCENGYFKNAQDMCERYTALNCKTFTLNANSCDTCETVNYYKDGEDCKKYTISNCQDKNTSANECITCENGYYLDSNKNCILNRLKHCHIDNINTTNNTCQTCNAGYSLQNGLCIQINIPGCIQYDANNCAKCRKDLYFDTTAKSCKVRTRINCKSVDEVEDKCTSCYIGFELNNSGDCEHQSIQYCKEYTKNSVTEPTSNTCEVCSDGYYPDNQKKNCLKQSFTYCFKFEFGTNNCIDCISGYKLNTDNSACEPIGIVLGCSSYNSVSDPKNPVCVECRNGLILNTSGATPVCESFSLIDGCLEYFVNTNKCKYCIYGRKVNISNNSCDVVTVKTNCLSMEYNSENCKTCQSGYYVDSNGDCELQSLTNCLSYKENENFCLTCSTGYEIISEKGLCVNFNRDSIQKIKNCIHYGESFEICNVCDFGYYASGGKCLEQNVVGCATYIPNENNCKYCQVDYLEGNGVCQERNLQPNCVVFADNSNNCVVCGGNFILDSVSKKCFNKFDFLLDYNHDHDDGTTADEKMNAETNCIQNRNELDQASTTEDELKNRDVGKCSVCAVKNKPSFEPLKFAAPKTTFDIYSNGCETAAGDLKNCELCDPAFKLDYTDSSNYTCSSSAPSTGFIDCYQLESGLTSSTDPNTGTNCLESPSDGSSMCLYPKYAVKNMTDGSNLKCEALSSLTGRKFIQSCDEITYNSNSTPTLSCDKCNDTTVAKERSVNSSFYECVNKNTNFDDSGATIKNKNTNCLVSEYYEDASDFSADDFNCLLCNTGYDGTTCSSNSDIGLTIVEFDSAPNYLPKDPSVDISNVSVLYRKYINTKLDNSVTIQAGCKIEQSTSMVFERGIRSQSEPKNSLGGYQNSIYVSFFSQYDKLVCQDLSSKFDGSANDILLNTSQNFMVPSTQGTSNSLVSTNLGGFYDVEAFKDIVDNTSNSNSPIYGAISCIEGKVQTRMVLSDEKYNTNQTLESNNIGFPFNFNPYNCVDPTGITVGDIGNQNFDTSTIKYGIEYNSSSNDSIIVGNIVNFTNCTVSTEKMLVFGFIKNKHLLFTDFNLEYEDSTTMTANNLPPMICISHTSKIFDSSLTLSANDLNGNSNFLAPNCHILALNTALTSSGNSTAALSSSNNTKSFVVGTGKDVFNCLACSPGFKPTAFTSTDGLITRCTAISGCTADAPSQKWLNACSLCATNYSWKYDSTNGKIFYDECVDSSTISNCLIYDETNTKCIYCLDNFILTDSDKCINPATDDELCNTSGISPNHNFTVSLMENLVVEFFNHFYAAKLTTALVNDISALTPYCQTCDSSNSVLVKSNSTASNLTLCSTSVQLNKNYVGTDEVQEMKDLSPDYCRKIGTNDSTMCKECISDYILLLDTFSESEGYCLENTESSTLQHCKIGVRDSGSLNFYCKECNDSYIVFPKPDSNYTSTTPSLTQCKETVNCKKYRSSDNICEVCKSDKIFDTNYETCVDNSSSPSDTDCLHPVYDGSCLKCSGSNFYPFNKQLSTVTNPQVIYQYNCIDQNPSTSINIIQVSELFTNYFGLRLIYKTNEGLDYDYTYMEEFNESELIITDFDTTHLSSKAFENGKLRYHCIEWPASYGEITNCVEYNPTNLDCVRCDVGFRLQPNSNTNINLNECSSRKYPLLNCAKYDKNKICIACQPGYKINTTQDLCVKVTQVPNCALYTAETNVSSPGCSICEYGFYKNGPNCSENNLSTCFVKNFTSKTCLSCFPGYILYNGNCYLNSASNCLKPHQTIYGLCEECESKYKNVNGSCILKSVPNPLCLEWNLNGVCIDCIPPYSLYDGVCKANNIFEIEGCVQYHSSKIQCAECIDGLILSNGYCIPPANINNCILLSKISNLCLGCEEGYFLLAGNCFKRKFLDCEVFLPTKDECISCLPSYLLSSTKRCIKRTAPHCKDVNGLKDECITCNDGYYFDRYSKKCIVHNAIGCKTRAPFSNKCQSCIQGSYLTQDGSCVPHTFDNCEIASKYSNNCVKCSKNHYLKKQLETADGDGYDFTNCLPYTALNCKEFDQNSDNCISCYEGYILHKHSRHNLSDPNNPKITVDCIKIEKENCLNWHSSNNSCTTCVSSHFIQNGNCFPRKISGCSRYSQNNDACESCPIGFYLQQNKCLAYSAQNCDTFNPEYDFCESCDLGFYLSNGRCLEITHPNCKSVSPNGNECLSCENNFYLQKGNCLPYNVICETYDPFTNTCLGCPSNRYLQSENSLCVPYSVQNCSINHPYLDECLSCVELHYLSEGLCLPYTVSSCKAFHPNYDECVSCYDGFYHRGNNCFSYNVGNCSHFSSYSDNCTACLDGHYMKDGNCLSYNLSNCDVLNQFENSCDKCDHKYYKEIVENSLYICLPNDVVENCLTYSGEMNACDLCEEGYYVNLETNKCIKNPDAISGCAEYADSTHCGVCSPPYYLTSSICKESSTIIQNCEIYKSDNICEKCEDMFLLSTDGNSCDYIKEFSCETYKDQENCKTCAGNQVISFYNTSTNTYTSGLNGANEANVRSVCVDSGINRCVKAIEDYPENKCLICEKNYYLDDFDKCQSVTESINNCEIYFSNGVCSQCLPNYVLSLDKTECSYNVSFLGPNCQEGKFVAEPNCFLCEKGYYLNESGNCEKCQMDGCSICLPQTPALCKLCMTGYYMNTDFTCVKDTSTPIVQDSGLEIEDRESDNQESNEILKYLFMIFILGLLKRFE